MNGAVISLFPAGSAARWQDEAACRRLRDDTFFPESGNSAAAVRICRECPVWRECRDYALRHRIEHGVWGGLSEEDRHRVLAGAGPRMCRNGLHVMTAKNTYTTPDGGKRCRACRNAADQRRRARRNQRTEVAPWAA